MAKPLPWDDKEPEYSWVLGLHYYVIDVGRNEWKAACMIGNDDIWTANCLSPDHGKMLCQYHFDNQIQEWQ